ncbi:hypothetical protein RN001_006787 [Aquatica leii]|uniref:Coiled-coil domain-containing protein 130 homolog n=1 Tax=Aquatica leii TaxID=1421715 RepID=A0AAN7SQC0_9COLE|nr:hypothetical protein RN001_006787 [Aquatica leii]
MGERKGTNKYYPPDYDPRAGGLNKWQGTHALRERARKIHMGIIIVRFEMPFNIWCEGCKNHIGMGVRYNAEKKKVGMYYTTPVFEFKMKCHLCDNHFLIKTDPANLEYTVLSGARRQENRWDPTQNEQVVPETKETQKRLFDDSMFKLEHGTDDQNYAETTKTNLIELFNRNENNWNDNYSANYKLRQMFRKTKNELKLAQAKDHALLKKSSLNLTLLPEDEEDKRMASVLSMKLKPNLDVEKNKELVRKSIISESSLPCSSFSAAKEFKAIKVLSKNNNLKNLVLIKKSDKEECSNKKVKLAPSLVGDYGSSNSESE